MVCHICLAENVNKIVPANITKTDFRIIGRNWNSC